LEEKKFVYRYSDGKAKLKNMIPASVKYRRFEKREERETHELEDDKNCLLI